MAVIYIVLPLALLFAAGALVAFLMATRSGQFDDVDTPSVRMLMDDNGQSVSPRSCDDAAGEQTRK